MTEVRSPSAGGDAESVKVNHDEDEGTSKGSTGRIDNKPSALKIRDEVIPLVKPLIEGAGLRVNTKEEKGPGNDQLAENQNSADKSSLYQKGIELLKTDHSDEALKCFLASLKGLKESNTFHELPQCLHQISDIYFSKNEYEKAVYFIQAEKMYYETALIDILTFQQEVANRKKQKQTEPENTLEKDIKESEEETTDDDYDRDALSSPEVAKANEFENLANLCLKEGRLQLAMEYCGKATKLFRETYGDEHPRTIKSLDLFTCIYADVGKKLYEDAMERFDDDKTWKQESSETSSGEPSTVRLRRKKVTFSEDTLLQDTEPEQNTELEPTPLPEEQDDWIVTCLLMVVFFLITVLIALIGSYLYCRKNGTSSFCAELRGDLKYWYIELRHLYHYYISGSKH